MKSIKSYMIAGVLLWVAVIAAYSSQVGKDQASGEKSYVILTFQNKGCSSSSSSSSGE